MLTVLPCSTSIPNCHVGVETSRPPTRHGSRCSKDAAGDGIKRGCTARFTVAELALDETIVKLSYGSLGHVEKSGVACHGPAASTALPEHQTAARLGGHMIDFITSAVFMGKCSRQILQVLSRLRLL